MSDSKRQTHLVRKVGDELTDWQRLRDALASDDVDEQTLLDTLEGAVDLPEALCAVGEEIGELEIQEAGLTAKITELQDRKSRVVASIGNLRGVILMAMDKAELETVRGPLFTITARRTPPKVEVVNEADLPARFWKQADPKIDKTALNEAVKGGEAVPGTRMGNGGLSLTIRKA